MGGAAKAAPSFSTKTERREKRLKTLEYLLDPTSNANFGSSRSSFFKQATGVYLDPVEDYKIFGSDLPDKICGLSVLGYTRQILPKCYTHVLVRADDHRHTASYDIPGWAPDLDSYLYKCFDAEGHQRHKEMIRIWKGSVTKT